MTIAARVINALHDAGLVNVVSVTIGDDGNRLTWTVTPSSEQAAAQPVINGFVIPDAVALLDEDATREIGRKELRAVAEALWESIPSPTMTKVQMRNRAIAIYKTL